MLSMLKYHHNSDETSRIDRDWRRRKLWRIPKGCRRCKAKAEPLRQKDRESIEVMFSISSSELLNNQQFLFYGGKDNGFCGN